MEIRILNVGTVVELEISDPYDVAQIIRGEVLALDSAPDAAQNLLVRLRSSITYKGRCPRRAGAASSTQSKVDRSVDCRRSRCMQWRACGPGLSTLHRHGVHWTGVAGSP